MANFELIKSEKIYNENIEKDSDFTLYYATPEDYVEVDGGGSNSHCKVKDGIRGKGVQKYPDGAWIVGFGNNINPNGFILHTTIYSEAFNNRIDAVKYFNRFVKNHTDKSQKKIKSPSI